MDVWGFEHIRSWLEARRTLPVGPLFCVLDGRTRGRAWSAGAAREALRRRAVRAGVRRRFAPHQLRHAHAIELAREGVPLNIIQRCRKRAGCVTLVGVSNTVQIVQPPDRKWLCSAVRHHPTA